MVLQCAVSRAFHCFRGAQGRQVAAKDGQGDSQDFQFGAAKATKTPIQGRLGTMRPSKTPSQGRFGVVRPSKKPIQGQRGAISLFKTPVQGQLGVIRPPKRRSKAIKPFGSAEIFQDFCKRKQTALLIKCHRRCISTGAL